MANVKKELTSEEIELYNELKKLSKRANQRIVRLEREFGKDTWAVKELKNKLATEPLQAWTKKGRVKVNKSMTLLQMKATIKETEKFLNKKTSTKRGIKQAKQKAIKTLQVRFGSETTDISYEEAETLTNFFEDREVNKITNFIPGSDVLALVEEAIENREEFETFTSKMESIIQYNKGSSIENLLRKIYIKYIFKGNKNTNEIDLLYSNVIELINNATTYNEISEIENIINNLKTENKINSKEYNYLLNLLKEKE